MTYVHHDALLRTKEAITKLPVFEKEVIIIKSIS